MIMNVTIAAAIVLFFKNAALRERCFLCGKTNSTFFVVASEELFFFVTGLQIPVTMMRKVVANIVFLFKPEY